jgi:LuxR family transcriptional regulator, maltose regulon positive regulatory protein
MSSEVEARLHLVPERGTPARVPVRLRPPEAAASDLHRAGLVRRLLDDPAPVTLVCGPAGAGKTSLVATCAAEVARAGAAVAWLSLDQRDNDPHALWDGILGALRATGSFPRGSRLHGLSAPRPDVDPGFVDTVLDTVDELGAEVWLVLDDVHVLHDAATVRSLEQLCLRLPSDLHLVLASRSGPAIGLARLRLQGRLRELGPGDLAFSVDETAAVLRARNLDLPEAAVVEIHRRTEGWIGGVAIAAMALAVADDPEELLLRFSGDDHLVADYLLSEVLGELPAELLAFLLQTSVCASLSPGLARELSGRQDAADVLEWLVRDNVFTERLGRDRTRYRYHELLRSFLTAELRRTAPDGTEAELHALTAAWLADHDEPTHALDHQVRAGDDGQLTALVDRHGLAEVLDGRAPAVTRILARLRSSAVEPVVALVGAAAAVDVGDPTEADRWFARIDLPGLIRGPDAALAAFAAAVALARARHGESIEGPLATLETTQAGSTGDPDRDLYAIYHRGVTRAYAGRNDDAMEDLERATALARSTDRREILVQCLSFLGGMHATISDLLAARPLAEQAVDLARTSGWTHSDELAHAEMLLAWCAHLAAEPSVAASHATLAVAALRDHPEPDVELTVRSVHFLVTAGQGPGVEPVRAYRAALARLADGPQPPAVLAYVSAPIVRVCLDLGEHAVARELAGVFLERLSDDGERGLLRAMLLHDAGRLDAARQVVDPLVRGATVCRVVATDVRLLLLAAVLHAARGDRARAHQLLLEALERAEPSALVEPFLWSEDVRTLLVTNRGRFGRLEGFAQRVLGATPSTSGAIRLTPGELAVLRELPSMLSLREIAEARALSLNTVKSHLRSVYAKLGVSSRREAVDVARLRNLL